MNRALVSLCCFGWTLFAALPLAAQTEFWIGPGIGLAGPGSVDGTASSIDGPYSVILRQTDRGIGISLLGTGSISFGLGRRIALEFASRSEGVSVFVDEPTDAGPPRFPGLDAGTAWHSALTVRIRAASIRPGVDLYIRGGPGLVIRSGRAFAHRDDGPDPALHLAAMVGARFGMVPVRAVLGTYLYQLAVQDDRGIEGRPRSQVDVMLAIELGLGQLLGLP